MIEVGTVAGIIAAIIIATILNTLAIWVVGKLRLGIQINHLGTALLAGALTAVFGVLLFRWTAALMGEAGSLWISRLVHLVVTAVILLLVGGILPGMRTKGFLGALVAAVAIAVLFFLANQIAAIAG